MNCKTYFLRTLILDLSLLRLETWNRAPSKSAMTISVDSGLWL